MLAERLVLLSEPLLLLQLLRQPLELPLESGPLAQWLVVPLQPLKLLLQVASLAVVLPQAVSYPQRKRLSWGGVGAPVRSPFHVRDVSH